MSVKRELTTKEKKKHRQSTFSQTDTFWDRHYMAVLERCPFLEVFAKRELTVRDLLIFLQISFGFIVVV